MWSFCVLCGLAPVPAPLMCLATQKLPKPFSIWNFYGGFTTQAWLIIPFPAPHPCLGNGSGTENFKLLIMAWSFWTSLYPRATRSPFLRIRDSPITQEIPRVLRLLCQKLESEIKYKNKKYSLWASYHFFRSFMPGTRGRDQYIFSLLFHSRILFISPKFSNLLTL